MIRNIKLIKCLIGFISTAVLMSLLNANLVQAEDDRSRAIIIFTSDNLNPDDKSTLLKKANGLKIKDLNLINGMAIYVSKKGKQLLKESPNVKSIEDDLIVKGSGKPSTTAPQPPQIIPWGVSKINADKVWQLSQGASVKIAVLDSGIDLAHPDLVGNIKGGYNTINPKRAATDDNGHGTHVAGIISACNNSIGVIGVAPDADLFAVKVLDGLGNGYVSDLIEGIEWSINNKMDIINYSLEVSSTEALHTAIIKANSLGIIQIASAGNDADNPVSYPAAFNEVLSVTSVDNNNEEMFSARGKIDISAPGTDIYSTFKSSSYTYMGGTSMASGYVTGTVALLLRYPNECDFNLDGKCSPDEVKQRLSLTALDLGEPGKDAIYGSGLINAYDAIIK